VVVTVVVVVDRDDLTLYPILQFGFLANPTKHWSLFLETDLAGGLTTRLHRRGAVGANVSSPLARR
jgi:hypothetical protein